MKRIDVLELSKECAFCEKPPTKSVRIKVTKLFGSGFKTETSVCKDHIEKAIEHSYKEFG